MKARFQEYDGEASEINCCNRDEVHFFSKLLACPVPKKEVSVYIKSLDDFVPLVYAIQKGLIEFDCYGTTFKEKV